jgi:hypothetical protein
MLASAAFDSREYIVISILVENSLLLVEYAAKSELSAQSRILKNAIKQNRPVDHIFQLKRTIAFHFASTPPVQEGYTGQTNPLPI